MQVLGDNDYICMLFSWLQLMRLFVGEPVWTAFNRPQDDHPARKEYMKCLSEKVGRGTGVALAAH